MSIQYKYISEFKFAVIAVIVLLAAIGAYLLTLYFDSFSSNYFVDDFAMKIFAVRESAVSFLFRIAPFLLTIVIAITSLTINTYSGTFLDLLLKDKRIKFFIFYSLFYSVFHILIIFFIDSAFPSDSIAIEDFYIEHFCVYLVDFILASFNILLTLYTAYKVFQYSWPGTLKRKFLKNIRVTLLEVEKKPLSTPEEINKFKKELNQQIGLFINLLLKAIKSKDYDSTRDTLNDIGEIWKEIVSYTNESEREQNDYEFREKLKDITNENPDLELEFDYAGDVYEIGLSKIAHVFSDSFEIAFSNGEYYVCEIILESVFDLTSLEKLNNDDIRKNLKILVDIFSISLRFDKKGQTAFFTEKTLEYINEVYTKTDFKDFDIYYDLLLVCLKLDDSKILKETLVHFEKIFNVKSNDDVILYKDTITQFQGTLIYCLKNKRMKCFAELLRFFVIGDLKIDILNKTFSEKIITSEVELDILQEFIDVLSENTTHSNQTYNSENYLKVKMYILWYSYYLLQCRISKERISPKNQNLEVPVSIKNKIPFELIRTVLLDIETHKSNWEKLFVGQESYYICKVAIELLDPKDYNKIQIEIEKYGQSEFLISIKEAAVPLKSRKLDLTSLIRFFIS